MNDNFAIQLFEGKKVRIVWDAEKEKYYFAVADIVQVLTDSEDVKQYIKRMRARDPELNSRWGTICTPTRMMAADGKVYKTQAADIEGIFRIIQSIPSKKAAATNKVSTDCVDFIGTYAPLSFTAADPSILFLGADNTLYYPVSGATIGAQRTYFKLKNVGSGVREFRLNFGGGDEDTQGIEGIDDLTIDDLRFETGAWYSLDGVRLNGKPTKKGLYINNGRKVVIP